MHRRVVAPLVALAVAACGDAFTAATSDGGGATPEAASALDTGAAGTDSAVDDAPGGDDVTTEDATTGHDATAEEAGHGKDGSVIILDGGPDLPDASSCLRACPAGFQCIAAKCVDRAAARFSATDNRPLNWSYGFATSLGGAFQLDTSEWTPGSSIDVWSTAVNTLEPSVFHNSGVTPQTYAEMTIPGGALGVYPGATGQASIVRWTAPAVGLYAIDVTFTGISSPATTVDVGLLVKNVTAQGTSMALNEFSGGNTFTYSAPAQTLMAGDAVDFYSTIIFARDDSPGGTSVDARITAQ